MNFDAKLKRKPIKAKRKRIINAKECKYELRDVLIVLFEIFRQAVEIFNKEIQQTPPVARPRGFEASLLNAKLMQCMQNSFSEDWKRGKYGRIMLYKNGYIIFFKKLNSKDMPMNIRTKMTDSIENQEQGTLFRDDNDGTAPILFFGYKKNRFGGITDPRIVYIDDGRVKWIITENDIDYSVNVAIAPPQLPDAHARIKGVDKIKTGTSND